MLSDDDRPLRAQPGPSNGNGANGHVATNGNGHYQESSPLSDDDDMPLVSQTTSLRLYRLIQRHLELVQSQTTRTTKSAPMTPDVRMLKRKKIVHHSSSSEDDTPLQASSPAKNAKSAAVPMPGAIQATTVPHANGKAKASKQHADNDSDFDDDVPIAKKKRATNGTAKGKPLKKRVKVEESEDDFDVESEDDKPIVKKRAAPNKGKRKMNDESDADDEDVDKPIKKSAAKKTPSKRAKKEEVSDDSTPQPKKKGGKAKKEEQEDTKKSKKKTKEEEEEDTYRWWEQQETNGDGSEKWQTLEHNGVYFPPPYEPLPSRVKMKYNGIVCHQLALYFCYSHDRCFSGKSVTLTPTAEEVAGFYAALLESDHAKDATFNSNFFEDFLTVLEKNPPVRGRQ